MALRRVPLTSHGLVDAAAVDAAAAGAEGGRVAAWGAPGQVRGPVVVRRTYSEQPPALRLRRDAFGAAAHGGALAKAPEGDGGASHRAGPPLESADAGEPAEMCAALLRAAGRSNDIRFVANGEVAATESYADLLRQAKAMGASVLAKLHVKRGDAVALQISDARMHLRAFWACALRGVAPVTVAVPNQYAKENATVLKLISAVRLLDVKHVLVSAGAVSKLQALLPPGVQAHDVNAFAHDGAKDDGADALVPPDPNDVLFYQLTSGSTGTPKVIPERHAAVVSHIPTPRSTAATPPPTSR